MWSNVVDFTVSKPPAVKKITFRVVSQPKPQRNTRRRDGTPRVVHIACCVQHVVLRDCECGRAAVCVCCWCTYKNAPRMIRATTEYELRSLWLLSCLPFAFIFCVAAFRELSHHCCAVKYGVPYDTVYGTAGVDEPRRGQESVPPGFLLVLVRHPRPEGSEIEDARSYFCFRRSLHQPSVRSCAVRSLCILLYASPCTRCTEYTNAHTPLRQQR